MDAATVTARLVGVRHKEKAHVAKTDNCIRCDYRHWLRGYSYQRFRGLAWPRRVAWRLAWSRLGFGMGLLRLPLCVRPWPVLRRMLSDRPRRDAVRPALAPGGGLRIRDRQLKGPPSTRGFGGLK